MRLKSCFVLPLILLMAAACAQNSPVSPTSAANAASTTSTPAVSPTLLAAPTAAGEATIQFIHAAPDVTAITIYRGSTAVAANLGYGQYSEPTTIPAGSYTLRALPAGSRADAAPLLEQAFSFQPGDSLLLVLNSPTTFLTLPNALPALGAGESAVTLVNLLSDVPDITLYQGSAALTAPIRASQISQAAILPEGKISLDIRTSTTTVQTINADLRQGFISTLVLAGNSGNPAVIQVETRAPGRTALRVVHASTAANAVDVYLDDQLLAANVEYVHPTERQDVVTGNYLIRVFPAGANTAAEQPFISRSVRFDSVPDSSLYILGTADNPVIGVYADDLSAAPQGKTRVTFVDTLDQFPSVRLETSSSTLVNTRFGEAPITILLDEGNYPFTWIGSKGGSSGETVEVADNVELRSGYSYWYLVTGRADNKPVILSEPVNVEASASASVPADAVQLRLINALQDQTPIEFMANDEVLATVEYARGTELITVENINSTIGARIGANLLAATIPDLQSGKRYTIVAYGAQAKQVKILVIPDAGLIMSRDETHLRLINASLDGGVRLGLAYSAAAPAVVNEPEGTEEPTIREYRRSIAAGVHALTDGVPGNAASGIILMSPGMVNLDVLDSNLAEMATTLAFMDLQAGAHYDVIAYQETNTPRVRAFLLKYPAAVH